jgi:hypothetical protein
MKLITDEFNFLIQELKNTNILNEEELKYVKSAHPQLYYTTINKKDEGVSLFTEKSFIYSLQNKNLNEFICEKFEEPLENLYMIHRLLYGVSGYARAHKDRFTTHKTISLILSDEFTGGDMYINDEKIDLNKNGEYVVFNGGKDLHEVKPILTGIRDVLIVWFSKKNSQFSLI